jgi:hypothetical protein
MRETLHLRVEEKFAHLLFREGEGRRLGSDIRLVQLSVDDPRFEQIGELQRQMRSSRNEPFFYGWELRREYQPSELASAQLLHMLISTTIDAVGELSGTVYDDTNTCPGCGAGAVQRGPLLIPQSKLPKRSDIARTHTDEIVLSPRMCELLRLHRFSGIRVEPVRSRTRRGLALTRWSQLIVSGTRVEIVAPTQAGIDPFDHDEAGAYRCPVADHLLGLNLLSELSVARLSVGTEDFSAGRQFVGDRRGVLRPWRPLFVRPRVRAAMTEAGVKGVDFEVAHLVD